jgi:hypothetical protein
MANSVAVMFQRNDLPEALPHNKSQALPAHRPNVAGIMPGGKSTAKSGGPRAKSQPWRSWTKKKKSSARSVMGY